ncbi:MAG: MFS transporter [Candidatus Nanopelagicales bacterium]
MKEWTPRRVTLALLAGVFISTFPRFLMPPMLLAMAADFGTTLTTITLAASAYFFVYGLAQPLWGLVSDRIGRVRTMRTALVLAAIGDLASTIPMPVEAFVVVRGLSGAFMAGVFPAAIIYIGDAVKDPRQRQPVIATLMSGVAIGITLGTLLGGLGVGTLGWRPMFWIAAGGSLLVSWSVRRLPEPVREPAPPVREAFRIVLSSGWSWVLYALVFVEAGVLLGGFAMIPASIEVAGGTPAVAGLLTASYGLSVLAMSAAARRASAHVAAARLLVVGGVGAVLGFGLLAIGLSAPLVVASVVLQGVAWVFMHSTLQTWATSLTVRARATAVSLFAGFMFLGNAVGTFLAGLALEDAGSQALFLIATFVAALLTATAAAARRRFEHRLV